MQMLPRDWLDLLQQVQAIVPRAVLAGGALRDIDNGLRARDLDFFVECGSLAEAEGLAEKLGAFFDSSDDTQVYPESTREIVAVASYDRATRKISTIVDLPIQFVFINWNVNRIVDRFDFGFCQIMSMNGTIEKSEAYANDKMNREMTLLRSDSPFALARSVERFTRWSQKYPGFRFRLGCSLNFDIDTAVII